MPVKHGPKGMRGRVPKLTPRQKVALRNPCERGKGGEHPRYLRRNGGWQSILTFDFFPKVEHDEECICEKLRDDFMKRNQGKRCSLDEVRGDCPLHQHKDVEDSAVWHARATTFPVRRLGDWETHEQTDVKRVLKRLLKNVGTGEIAVRKGSEVPPHSIHFYVEATPAEIVRAGRKGGRRG